MFISVKKHLPLIMVLAGALFIFAFLAWALSSHGTIGLYRVNIIARAAFIFLGACGFLLLGFGCLHQWLKQKGNSVLQHRLSVLIAVIALPVIIVLPVTFFHTSGAFSAGIGDTPPQLLIADGAGAYGIPDIAVAFNAAKATTSSLAWGNDDGPYSVTQDEPSKQHVFMLKDLVPDTRYWYRVDDGPVAYFITPPADGRLRFAVAGDTHFGSSRARNDVTAEMLEDIASRDNGFDLFFFLGDLVEYGFMNSQWQEAFESFSAATATIPVRYVAGNHDTLFSGLSNYKNYCYPEGMPLQTGSRLWYRVDVGDISFLFLDLEWSAESYTPAQAEWLEAQLKSIPADNWKVVLSHGYFYASGIEGFGWKWYDNPETIETITPLFIEYGVDLVCSSHSHSPELLANGGIIYALSGVFGGLPDPERTYISPYSLWYANGLYSFIDITIDGDTCTLVFRDSSFEAFYTFAFDKNR